MREKNLFYPIYLNLEKELMTLAEWVFFDDENNDKQMSVYSIRIAELLIRTVIEIEALSKALYFDNGGTKEYDENSREKHLYFDTDCLDYLEKSWGLSEKEVIVSSPHMHFSKEENRVLTPLKNANKRGKCDWKKAYQAVKHDRVNNISRANVKNLIRAMAGLYLLNIYYRDESFSNHIVGEAGTLDLGSAVFCVKIKKQNEYNNETSHETGDMYPSFTYISRFVLDSFNNIKKRDQEDSRKAFLTLVESQEYKAFLASGQTLKSKHMNSMAMEIGEWAILNKMKKLTSFEEKKEYIMKTDYYRHLVRSGQQKGYEITQDSIDTVAKSVGKMDFFIRTIYSNITGTIEAVTKGKKEIILNKKQRIYPENPDS